MVTMSLLCKDHENKTGVMTGISCHMALSRELGYTPATFPPLPLNLKPSPTFTYPYVPPSLPLPSSLPSSHHNHSCPSLPQTVKPVHFLPRPMPVNKKTTSWAHQVKTVPQPNYQKKSLLLSLHLSLPPSITLSTPSALSIPLYLPPPPSIPHTRQHFLKSRLCTSRT